MSDFDPVHRVRVRYCDTDRMAVAHHGSYVLWFEEARSEWFRRRGKSYREMEEEGDLLQVVDLQCRYHSPVDYDDIVEIAVSVRELKRVSVTLAYECRRAPDGALCATGSTKLACVGRDGRVRRLPAGFAWDS